ncbi:hypothetical protein [Aurantimonas sp. 22II-16-19i]|uniref:hypothetical protein n=1 Tax=Aurantimonas sp. 22II-16-19i TaxID=1317114 RepID=UPI0009F7BE40|nr:hypothetical protein [Aurantimonas sp. 22II-16-19i]ORE85739.1 hypothetical protein ATO4_26247 [Aurantimonas sp. 22II-16-19i]
MPVRQGGRTIRDPKTGKEKHEGGTRQERSEGEIPKGHPAKARLAELAKAAAPAIEDAPAAESGKTAAPRVKD